MRLTFLLAAVAVLAAEPAAARGPNFQDGALRGTLSPKEARDAGEEGRHVPLRDILAEVQRRYPGRSLGAALSRDRPAMYEITWLTNDGRRLHIRANAETGQIVSVSGG
jgi:uncharacterized membrane protein YkoI